MSAAHERMRDVVTATIPVVAEHMRRHDQTGWIAALAILEGVQAAVTERLYAAGHAGRTLEHSLIALEASRLTGVWAALMAMFDHRVGNARGAVVAALHELDMADAAATDQRLRDARYNVEAACIALGGDS